MREIGIEGTSAGPLAHFQRNEPGAGEVGRLRNLAGNLLTALLALIVLAAVAATLGPLFLPYRTFSVLSGSMSPGIPVGALVLDLPATPAQVRVGDVVTFPRPDAPGVNVTHRVSALEPGGPSGVSFRTRGDANGSTDPWLIQANETNWRVAAIVPLAGYALGYMRSPLGQLLTFVMPAVLLGLLFLHDIWRRPADAAGEPA